MAESEIIRVVIAGVESAMRSSLSAAIHAHRQMHLVGEAANGREAVELCGIAHPSVVLLDLDLPRSDSILATHTIRQRWPDIHIILLVSSDSDERLPNALKAGARDYLLKSTSYDGVTDLILRTCRSQRISDHGGKSDISAPPLPRRTIKELEMAGRIQAGILPDKPPALRGWDLAARMISAHETSGDFYDFIPLSNGKWGIVIADVTDKGIGAAVFMALCSTLIRTYADRYQTLPAIAINSVNERIFSDTRGSLYVTVFHGILEPEIGRLRYVNAGHNPPMLVSSQRGKTVDRLQRTGMALGVSPDATWQQKIVKFIPGDTLVLYTDGITEAQDPHGRFFGEQRLTEIVRSRAGRPAQEILDAVMAELDQFRSGTALQDDTTIVVMTRQG